MVLTRRRNKLFCNESSDKQLGITDSRKLVSVFFYKYRWPLVGASAQFFFTSILRIDNLFYEYSKITTYYVVVKILYYFFLMTVWCFGYDFYHNIKDGKEIYIRGRNIFVVYFSIVFLLLMIVWPGTWALDDIRGLDTIRRYESFYPWQHILTGLYQDILLQVLPFPGGIILQQNIIVSLCVAYVITKLEQNYVIRSFKNKYADIIIKLVPFLLPPVLDYQLSGYRMGLYVYLELLLIIIIICDVLGNREITWGKVFFLCLLTCVCATWRSESFLYIPCICVLILRINKSFSRNKKKTALIIILFVFFELSSWQNLELINNNYKVISLCRPCVELLRKCNNEENSELLKAINCVIKVQTVYDNPDVDGERLYWDKELVDSWYTEEEYKNFISAFLRLALKYPDVVAKERWSVFAGSLGIRGVTYNNIAESALIFDDDNDYWAAKIFRDNKWIFLRPIFKKIRKIFIYYLGCMNTEGKIIKPLHLLIWNAVFPILVLCYAWLDCLLKKKWNLFILSSTIILRIPIVFTMQPSGWFMYILSFYFLGWVYFTFKIIRYRNYN